MWRDFSQGHSDAVPGGVPAHQGQQRDRLVVEAGDLKVHGDLLYAVAQQVVNGAAAGWQRGQVHPAGEAEHRRLVRHEG